MKKIFVRDLSEKWKVKQDDNIKAFNSLDRAGLDNKSVRRKLLLKKFDTGEKLYIIYPGKESVATNRRKFINKNDFYPKLILENGNPMKTVSFGEVWEDLFTLDKNGVNMSALATIFIRMAYMYDSKKIKKTFSYDDYRIQNDKEKDKINSGKLELEYYEYSLDNKVLEELDIPTNLEIKGSKIIPYLTYIDLISQNEDCKYSLKKGESWNFKTGRMNTCLTHVTMIAYLEDKVILPRLFEKLMRGVAPITQNEFGKVTNNRICKN